MEQIMKCLSAVRKRTDFVPQVALVLGSGLGDLAEAVEPEAVIGYEEIEGFPISTVPGHRGRFILGYLERTPVVVMQGRVHYYEGYSMQDVVLPIRLMGLMGAKTLFLTNAAGGVQEGMQCGDLMLIRDHISCFVPNPLIGPNPDALGERFPDMSHVYDPELMQIIIGCADELGISLKKGVYLQLTGPSYETPSEISMCRLFGADAVGMSTAVEAVAARHMGMRICGLSLITNLAAGISKTPLSHEEVKLAGQQAGVKFQTLVRHSVAQMREE